MTILIKNGRVVDPATKTDKKADVLVEKGLVKRIGQGLNEKAAQVIDAKGLVVCPGFIDVHVHLREPGFEEKETIETGCRAAIAGGVTSLLCMPNTNPVIDDASLIDYIKEKQAHIGLASVYPVAALTKKSQGKELTEMFHLAKAGAIAFSDDGNNVDDPMVMRRALEYSTLASRPVLVHAEDSLLAANGQINEGLVSTKLGLRGLLPLAEEIIIFRDIEFAKITGAKVHFQHVSTAGSIELIRQAKKENLPITCEVTPHHLLLEDTALAGYDTNFKVKPPLRGAQDREALIQGLKDGTVDCIATDHAPHAKHQKEVEFDYAAFGLVGLETLFSLIFTHFEKDLGLVALLEKITSKPAQIFNLDAGVLQENKIADVTIFDPKAKVEVDTSNFLSKSKNSPFNGWQLNGKIEYVIKGGKIVFKEGRIRDSS